ncbi:dmX-like protein 2 isoform X2 [Branchiostoma floridae x Branchiostoma belcheri]
MKQHQVLTGAVNPGDHCFAVGNVDGSPFTAYGSGCDLVILGSDFQRVQIFPGTSRGNIQVGCVDCSQNGKIAASYANNVYIFEPYPGTSKTGATNKLGMEWQETGGFSVDSLVTNLSWNHDGTRLLVGSNSIQLWGCPDLMEKADGMEEEEEEEMDAASATGTVEELQSTWACIWQCRTATAVCHLQFSPDGQLFASAGKEDRLVKIWFDSRQWRSGLQQDWKTGGGEEPVSTGLYSFIYIAHPRAVTGFSWRRTSKYMPKGSIANCLVTSCRDNICRIWCETVLPEHSLALPQQERGLIDSESYQAAPQRHTSKFAHTAQLFKPVFQTVNNRRVAVPFRNVTQEIQATAFQFLFSTLRKGRPQKKNKIRHNLKVKRRQSHPSGDLTSGQSTLTPQRHSLSGEMPALNTLHFHLSVTINLSTDIPLLPVVAGSNEDKSFVVHWLNNKELQFTLVMELFLRQLRELEEQERPLAVSDRPDSDNEDYLTEDDARSSGGLSSRSPIKTPDSLLKSPGVSTPSLHSLSVTEVQAVGSSSLLSLPTSSILDRKIESLLRDWNRSADMLFSIHPVDGSFLVWLVEYLDETHPGAFRQAQVSFASRIPAAFPVGDAMGLSSTLLLYCDNTQAVDSNLGPKLEDTKPSTSYSFTHGTGKGAPTNENVETFTPTVMMLSKHSDGSLNQWEVNFAQNSAFSTVVSVSHRARCCGHRFHLNELACHPVLPLLLTTSHHNIPHVEVDDTCSIGSRSRSSSRLSFESGKDTSDPMEMIKARLRHATGESKHGGTIPEDEDTVFPISKDLRHPHGLCSELILWRVDPVGPLSFSGGVTELARINSSHISAFSNVAWVPTLLPSSSLGGMSNSYSACFVASDGDSLRLYQAVIDARMLLQETANMEAERLAESEGFSSGPESVDMAWEKREPLFKIVSQQSTKRPGCVIELDTITQAKRSWKSTQLLHVFQEEFLLGQKQAGEMSISTEPVDTQPLHSSGYDEGFYLVVLEKVEETSVLHMWYIEIVSQLQTPAARDMTPKFNSEYAHDSDTSPETSEPNSPTTGYTPSFHAPTSKLVITSHKVYEAALTLPEGVQVVDATPAAGHLSSASIYPACLAPYLIVTACSDGKVRFWRCNVSNKASEFEEFSGVMSPVDFVRAQDKKYRWVEWELMVSEKNASSAVQVDGEPVAISSAYNGRFACGFKVLNVPSDKQTVPLDNNAAFCVAIFECESTGGSEWIVEDTLFLSVPDTSPDRALVPPQQTKYQVLQLDWVSKEDGSHILTVGVGPKVFMYTPVSPALHSSSEQGVEVAPNGLLASMFLPVATLSHKKENQRWMLLRSIDLLTPDGLEAHSMSLSWVRDGILVVGLGDEKHVYSQWSSKTKEEEKVLLAEDVASQDNLSSRDSPSSTLSTSILSRISAQGNKTSPEKPPPAEVQSKTDLSQNKTLHDIGLFEAAYLASPTLPQYHPQQLMEIMNFGKFRRVRAILSHIVRCISSDDQVTLPAEQDTSGDETDRRRHLTRGLSMLSRSYSISADPFEHGQEGHPDFVELESIPPLPLYALLAADSDKSAFLQQEDAPTKSTENNADKTDGDAYSTLFEHPDLNVDEDFIAFTAKSKPQPKTISLKQFPPTYFGPEHARILTNHLTHSRLPGLSSLEQMQLLAVADTLAHTRTEFSEGTSTTANSETVDGCGLRYLIAMRHHLYLLRSLPPVQRAQVFRQGLATSNFAWAFHSESEADLLNMIPSLHKGQPTWKELRALGVGWWLRNNNTLRTTMEKVAKAAFQNKNDPMDAALYYMAMKKKTLVWGLFRSVKDKKMMDFFHNNFNEDRWRRAALKNAFALLGKQRFEHAAAFFLLAGSLPDAIEVCINKLEDLQLAMVVARLYSSNLEQDVPDSQKQVLYEHILGLSDAGEEREEGKIHPDPFLRSIAYWLLKDHTRALNCLLQQPKQDDMDSPSSVRSAKGSEYSANPEVFNFYNWLRTHPLLLRRHLSTHEGSVRGAQATNSSLLAGVGLHASLTASEKGLADKITPIERRLYFTTAHAHFTAGCPMLALEVLSKLPQVTEKSPDNSCNSTVVVNTPEDEEMISKGVITITQPSADKSRVDSVSSLDWSKPVVSSTPGPPTLDWSQPAVSMDWSQPVSTLNNGDKLELDWGNDDDEVEDEDEEDMKPMTTGDPNKLAVPAINKQALLASPMETEIDRCRKVDIMAQQLKFIACLKILMQELRTLATGYEVDGGQLRYHLYMWLEREIDALRKLCNYRYGGLADDLDDLEDLKDSRRPSDSQYSGQDSGDEDTKKRTLHEILLAEKMDFEAKRQRSARRKHWLKRNHELLRTFLSYCSLHGAGGGGLASVRMELILLLQECQQEKTQQQLLSPLPFPTMLPLVTASVASSKTVVADPIAHIVRMTHDILHTVVAMTAPPSPSETNTTVYKLQTLSAAVSACMYQCLCDSDTYYLQLQGDVLDDGLDQWNSIVYHPQHLMEAGRKRRISSGEDNATPSSAPAKWPGVSSLQTLLASERDEDQPKLNVLLSETLVAVYVSLLIHGLAGKAANELFHLVAHPFDAKMWAAVFGGGVKVQLKQAAQKPAMYSNARDAMDKQRLRLNLKLLGKANMPSPAPAAEDKPVFKEKFIPPEVSMLDYFITKPYIPPGQNAIDYDSDETVESESEDEDADSLNISVTEAQLQEHSDPNSYSWSLMRLALVKIVFHNVQNFLPTAGIEMAELPVASPLLHAVLKNLELWQQMLIGRLELFNGPPLDYIPLSGVESSGGPALLRYKAMLEPTNTPFRSNHRSALPAKRLWHHLVHQEVLQDAFIRYCFTKKAHMQELTRDEIRAGGRIRIIHKENEIINCFCTNQANPNCIVVASASHVQELDVSAILNPQPYVWIDEEQPDMESVIGPKSAPGNSEMGEFLFVHTGVERKGSVSAPASPNPHGPGPAMLHSLGYGGMQTGRGGNVMLKRSVSGVRRMASHPTLPYYLTGCQDGSVRMWEWGHAQQISIHRTAGYPRVNRVRFNLQGNKFGVCDSEGYLSLWQLAVSSSATNKPFLTRQCHNKQTSDFVYINSSSFLSTAGHSSDHRNVCLWDTLMPHRSCLVQGFTCHESGSPAIVYAPQQQLLISSGRKGDICIFDVRQRQLRHTFQAHESAVKCLALDPTEEFFVTGSVDGEVKVWGLLVHNLLYSFPAEHMRTSIFRNLGAGVTQLHLGPTNHMFSCGADGTLKWRLLPDRDNLLQTL